MIVLRYRQRVALLGLLGGCGALLLLVRLFTMQVVERKEWVAEAQAQAGGWRPIRGRRGRILDAAGAVLAADESGFDLTVRAAAWTGVRYACSYCGNVRYLTPDEASKRADRALRCRRCKHREPSLHRADRRDLRPLAELLEVPSAELEARVRTRVGEARRRVAKRLGTLEGKQRERARRLAWADEGWRERKLASGVSYAVAREVELHPARYPGFSISTVQTRRYLAGNSFVHLLGRVAAEKETAESPDYDRRTIFVEHGLNGLEGRFDPELRGETGWVRIVRNPRNRVREAASTHAPVAGLDLRLTIASKDQHLARQALAGVEGAFLVVDARRGAVLAMASAPDYAPEEYVSTVLAWQRRVAETGSSVGTPLIDRACRAFQPPGSIMKPFTAVAAELAEVADPQTRITCEGFLRRADGTPIPSHKCHAAHGELDLHGALVHSCNVYFETLMRRIVAASKVDRFVSCGRSFGFGAATGIEIEKRPQPDTFRIGRDWGLRLASAIGQGYVRLSAAQMVRAYAALATGALPTLHLVKRIGSRAVAPPPRPLGIDPAILRPIREALREVPIAGTARGHGLERFAISCKTGTAQTGRRGEHHSWIAGYAPARKGRPAIAFCIVVFRTGLSTAQVCGPRLEEFLRAFYREGTP